MTDSVAEITYRLVISTINSWFTTVLEADQDRNYCARLHCAHFQPVFSKRDFAKVHARFAENVIMNTPKPSEAAIIDAAVQTLELLCRIRGIEPEDLDDAEVDKLLWSSFEEYLGSGSIIADAAFARRR